MHKVHCVKTIVLKVNLKCMTICQLARKDNKCTHKLAIQHIHLLFNTYTYAYKQTHLWATAIIRIIILNACHQVGKLYTYFKVALNSFSSTTSKYKAFGITTKTIAAAQYLQNLQKYKKCLNSYVKKCLAIVCLAIFYKLHKTLTLHNPNTLYIATKVS